MLIRFRSKAVAISSDCSRFHCNGFGDLLSSYSYGSQYFYSSAPTHFLVKFLVDSLGFSNEEASLASSKVISRKSSKNPDLVHNFLIQTGLDKTQMKKMVSSVPKMLFSDVSKTLKPKFQCLMDLGLSRSDLVNVIAKDEKIIERGLDTHLRPTIDLLRRIMGSDEDVRKVIKISPWLLTFGPHHIKETNLLLLKNFGFSDVKIRKLVLRNPRFITQRPEWFKDLLYRVEKDFRVPRQSPMFPYGFQVLSSHKKPKLERKLGIFKSFGWSDDDVLHMFRKLPHCVALSEVKLQKVLSLFMKELGFEPAYLASHPSMLAYSPEKRVVPRMQVLKILDEKKLERRKWGLYSVLMLSESRFIEYFVLPYKNKIPDLYKPLEKTLAP